MSRDLIRLDDKLWEFSLIGVEKDGVHKNYIVLKKYGDNDALLVNIDNGEVSLQVGVHKHQIFNLDNKKNIVSSEITYISDDCLATWKDISEVDFDKARSLIENNVDIVININKKRASR